MVEACGAGRLRKFPGCFEGAVEIETRLFFALFKKQSIA